MPLQLGGIETERPQVITWDPSVGDQVMEADSRVADLVTQGYKVRKTNGCSVTLDPPPLDPNIGVFRILSQNGDDRVVWDRTIPAQVKDAYKKFKELMKKGYTAYATLASGKKGHKITEFDPGLQEILLVPTTVPG